jgi:hypothetical protein
VEAAPRAPKVLRAGMLGGWLLAAGLAATALSGVACVGGSKGLSSEDKERLKPYILPSAPADIPHKIDINFENKVHLIGYKFEPETAKPGQDVKLTYYWRVDDTLDDGWMLFTHMRDEVADHNDNLDFSGPLREDKGKHQILGPDRWEKGKVYVDEQTYKMPDWLKGPELTIMVGIWKGDARLRIISGPSDGDNRAIVGKVKTGLTPPAEEKHSEALPRMIVHKLAANEKIVIDGKGDDKAWGGATSTGPFVDVGTGKSNTSFPVNGGTKLAWDDQNLYALYEVLEEDPYVGFTDAKAQPKDFTKAGQPKLWTKDTVEMMVDPDGDGDMKDYYELQFNPQNKVFKSQFDTLQQPNGGPDGPFGHEDWDPKLKSAVVLRKDGEKVTGYTVEVAIPWAAFSKAQNHPPKPGDTWRMNFYAMKNNGGVAWSPILGKGNFHYGPRFGRVVWAVPGMPMGAPPGMAAPGASGSAGPRGLVFPGGGSVARPGPRPPTAPPPPPHTP